MMWNSQTIEFSNDEICIFVDGMEMTWIRLLMFRCLKYTAIVEMKCTLTMPRETIKWISLIHLGEKSEMEQNKVTILMRNMCVWQLYTGHSNI